MIFLRKNSLSRYTQFFLFVWVVLAGLLIAQPHRPFLGNFSTKAVCYSMIGNHFIKNPSDILKPMVDIIVNGNASLHIVELPWPSYVTALFQMIAPIGFEFWGRALSLCLLPLFYFLLVKYFLAMGLPAISSDRAAFFASLSPGVLIYYQSFQMEAWAMTLLACSFYTLIRYVTLNRKQSLILFNAVFSAVLLLKPHWGVFVLPMFFLTPKKSRTVVMIAKLFFIPFLLAATWVVWNYYLAATEKSVFFSLATSLQHNQSIFSILSQPLFYKTLLKTLLFPVLGPVSLVLLMLGVLPSGDKSRSDHRIFQLSFLAFFIMVLLLPKKFQEINYYYLPMIIPAAYFMERGWLLLCDRSHLIFVRPLRLLMLFGYVLISIVITFKVIYTVAFNEVGIPAAGQKVHQMIPADAKILAVSGSSPALLYYSNRLGWTGNGNSVEELMREIEKRKKEGLDYFVTADPIILKNISFTNGIDKIGEVIISNESILLVRVKHNAAA
jgi:hypothetical protein